MDRLLHVERGNGDLESRVTALEREMTRVESGISKLEDTVYQASDDPPRDPNRIDPTDPNYIDPTRPDRERETEEHHTEYTPDEVAPEVQEEQKERPPAP